MKEPHPYDAVIPLFLENRRAGEVSAVGSCVFVNLGGEHFLLTAAHVTDHTSEDHILMLPAGDELIPVEGGFAEIGKVEQRSKEARLLDASYYHLSSEFSSRLYPDYRPITQTGIDLFDEAADGNLYSIAGYPADASKGTLESCSAEFFAFTGTVPHERFYRKLGLQQEMHVLMQFNVRRNVILRGPAKTSPMPQGMSGGALFSWPRGANPLQPNPNPKLVGITTDWDKRHAIFTGTRIYSFIKMIELNNPGLIRLIPADLTTE